MIQRAYSLDVKSTAEPPAVISIHCIFTESLHRDFVVFNTYGNHRHTWLLSKAMQYMLNIILYK